MNVDKKINKRTNITLSTLSSQPAYVSPLVKLLSCEIVGNVARLLSRDEMLVVRGISVMQR